MTKPKLALLAILTLVVGLAFAGPLVVRAQDPAGVEQPDLQTIAREIANTPPLLAALIGLAWNIGGYIINSAEQKKLAKYEKTELLKTLTLFETLFFILSTIAGMPISWVAALTLTLAFIRSLKKAIEDFTAGLAAQKNGTGPAASS